MKLQIFALYDKKALAYVDVFHFPQIGQAIRQVEDLLKTQHPLAKHPADYDLYKLGEFDDVSGSILPQDPGPQFIQTALSLSTTQAINPELLQANGKRSN